MRIDTSGCKDGPKHRYFCVTFAENILLFFHNQQVSECRLREVQSKVGRFFFHVSD